MRIALRSSQPRNEADKSLGIAMVDTTSVCTLFGVSKHDHNQSIEKYGVGFLVYYGFGMIPCRLKAPIPELLLPHITLMHAWCVVRVISLISSGSHPD